MQGSKQIIWHKMSDKRQQKITFCAVAPWRISSSTNADAPRWVNPPLVWWIQDAGEASYADARILHLGGRVDSFFGGRVDWDCAGGSHKIWGSSSAPSALSAFQFAAPKSSWLSCGSVCVWAEFWRWPTLATDRTAPPHLDGRLTPPGHRVCPSRVAGNLGSRQRMVSSVTLQICTIRSLTFVVQSHMHIQRSVGRWPTLTTPELPHLASAIIFHTTSAAGSP